MYDLSEEAVLELVAYVLKGCDYGDTVGRHAVGIKQRQQATWASGDYAVIGTTLQIVGENLTEAADVRAGERVLDVAAGNGNASLAAARRWCQVTATDYVPALLKRAHERAAAERAVTTHVGARLGLSGPQAARGILSIIDNNMVGAIRVVSVERGHDPRDFVLLPFGGAGPLHATSLARLLGI